MPWNENGARASIRADRPGLFIEEHVSPLFYGSTKSTRRRKHSAVVSEEQFWGRSGDVLFGSVELKGFMVTDWFPRAPGVFWSERARFAREQVYDSTPENDPELGLIYSPASKTGLIERGGVGTIRLLPHRVDGTRCWFATAVTSFQCHAGVPLAIPDAVLEKSGLKWGEVANVRGPVRFLHDVGLDEVADSVHGVRPLILLVEALTPVRAQTDTVVITPVVLFETDQKHDRAQYAFVQCPAGSDSHLDGAAEWIEKYSAKHSGRIITNFDQQRPILANAPLSYQKLLSRTYDRTIVEKFTGTMIVDRIDSLSATNQYFGETHVGHNINVTGPAIVAIDSTLNNVIQTIGAAQGLNDNEKSKLGEMVQSLRTELDAIKSSHPEEAKEIAEAAQKAVVTASKPPEERKKSLLQLSAKGLTEAAELVKDIAPTVLSTAGLIAKFVTGLG
jgi:hypothetical protein